jgi:hypothetical protein
VVGPTRESLLRQATLESQFWHMVRQAAANDPALMDMLNEVKAFYLLKYGGQKDELEKTKYTSYTSGNKSSN